ncbi:MAG: hypothetical protein LQ338_003015 [Usnochroma carphineum]|nr:MAG: hypothetical protein LQ338_003015 [Usnochroma carphineum]
MTSSTNLDQKSDASPPLDPPEEDGMHTSTNSTSPLVRGRPKTTYFHGGIGGAGNYRKVIRPSNPNSVVPYAHTEHRASPISRGLSNLFGGSSGGAGGGGNSHPGREQPQITNEEDLERANVHKKVSPSRGFLSIGGLGNKRQQRQPSPASDESTSTNADSGYVSQSNNPTTHLGAAEIMRRKMLGEKPRPNGHR